VILILLAVSLGVPALLGGGCYIHSLREAKAYAEWFDSPEYKRRVMMNAAAIVESFGFHDEALTMLRDAPSGQGAQP
jgi:hypothetical protein